MINDKISSQKIILAIVILLAFVGIVAYSVSLKKSSPVAVQPTVSTTVKPTATPTPAATITPTPTPIINISDWKIYKNEKYGFEFNYPQDWIGGGTEYDLSKLQESNFFKGTGTEFEVIFSKKDLQGSVFVLRIMNKTIEEAISFDHSSFGDKTGKTVIIGGIKGEMLNGAFYGMQYVVTNGKTYFFEQTNATDETDWAKYDRVISTFKFIK